MERLRRTYIVVAQEGAEPLDLFGRDFDGIVQHRPNDPFVTGWCGL